MSTQEITEQDTKAIDIAALKYAHQFDRDKQDLAIEDFNEGAEWGILHERAAAKARIAELEALLKRSVDLMCGANRNGILLEGAWWTEQIQELLRRKEIRPYKP